MLQYFVRRRRSFCAPTASLVLAFCDGSNYGEIPPTSALSRLVPHRMSSTRHDARSASARKEAPSFMGFQLR